MYKVLIADDEDIICRGLASMVSQHSELQVVALAEDGEIALEKAKDTMPDLMLVDINMPFLNGLEFIEKAREILPDVVVIIITGYDDFEFVQKALQLGAADYLLKPVMEQPFFEVLNRAVERLDRMNKSKRYLSWVKEQMEQNRFQMVNDFFHNWLSNQMDDGELENQMSYLKIQMPSPYWLTVMHIYKDYEKDAFQDNGSGNDDSLFLKCCDIVRECFERCSEVICFRTEEGALAVVSDVLPQQQWEELSKTISAAIEEKLCAKMESVQQQGDGVAEFPAVFKQIMDIYKERMHYSDVVLQTISIINMQWGNSDLSLQSVADSLYVSAPHLSRMFHRETGENFAAYLTRKRISEAKLLLKNTNMRMYEIAQKTGYTSQHYFSNAFKKTIGISPADYRKNILQ